MASRLRQTLLAGGSLGTDHFLQNAFSSGRIFLDKFPLRYFFWGIITPLPRFAFPEWFVP